MYSESMSEWLHIALYVCVCVCVCVTMQCIHVHASTCDRKKKKKLMCAFRKLISTIHKLHDMFIVLQSTDNYDRKAVYF